MRLGIILQSNNPEHIWNTFRLANATLKAGHSVQIFLFNEGVEAEDIPDTEHFDISKKIAEFKSFNGSVFACKTCLNIRSKEDSKIAPISSMEQLVKIIEESDKVLVFG
ncbi:MAG: hypothetical protein A2Z24_01715 [Candidatus Woykebacteria bacterium RBG_16_44_10]|uniref:Uncharacterized protein n=1 Tax=Candidatus Woykebacteria bacterium RBG_16_44_10 TaxID=1802597 RepID=A0A1G1WD55_9BACT|nr:MAG: hypothetical protein A2Z24_01715 [Candidatus Woykebacteria bacterium RBG_16_44_10]